MSIRDLLDFSTAQPLLFAGMFGIPPVVALLLGLIHGSSRGDDAPWKFFYAVLVYLVCAPGIFSSVLILFTFVFAKRSLLDVDLITYAIPIVSMIVSLIVMRRNVDFRKVPGFNRLNGLMIMIAATFGVLFLLERTKIWLIFGAPMTWFLLIAIGLFVLIRWGATLAFRSKNRSK